MVVGLNFLSPTGFLKHTRTIDLIDIVAESDEDMMNWKGWVGSRMRYLVLKIERDTSKMLQCHPHPGDFSDSSNPFHCSYFLGLQRKEGVPVNEAKKFDIRLTVEEYKANVGSYSLWKPGMDINVTHIKRRDIPAFVFPGGIRPTRPARVSVEGRQAPEIRSASIVDVATSVDGPDSDSKKRKRDDDDDDTLTKLTAPESLKNDDLSSNGFSVGGPSTVIPKGVNVIDQAGTSGIKNEILDQNIEDVSGQLTSGEAEKLAIEKLMAGPYESHDSSPRDLEELEELDNIQNKNLGQTTKGTDMQFPAVEKVASSVAVSDNTSGSQANGNVEELEAPELDVPLPRPTHAAVASQKKPIIKLSFTSLAKATGNTT